MASKERIENAIRHIQTATDIDPWAMEIAVNAMLRMLNADGDLISRQAAMNEFASLVPYAIDDAVTEAYAHGLSDGYAVICNLPSAQPDRKTGRWTDDNACQFCGFQPWYERNIHTLSFCPNCGADMRGDQDE